MIRIRTAEEFGQLVRERRLALNMSQQELATKVSKSRNWLASVELGKTMPTLPGVLRVATALGLVTGFEERDREDDAFLAMIKRGGRDV